MVDVTNNEERTFLVIPDTNIIWSKPGSKSIFPQNFVDSWASMTNQHDCRLRIPEVVSQERIFRVAKYTQRCAQNALDNIEYLRHLLKDPLDINLPDSKAAQEAAQNHVLDEIEKLPKAKIIPTPFKNIDWKQVVELATRREPPFDPEKEKGFRDCVILETVKYIVACHPHYDVAFIVEDRLLRQAANEQLSDSTHFATYSSLDEFKNFVDMVSDRFPPEFLHQLTVKASRLFFDKGNPESFFVRENIGEKIRDDHKIHIDPLSYSDDVPNLQETLERLFEPLVDPGQFYIGDSQLVGLVRHKEFHWETSVVLRAIYKKNRLGIFFKYHSFAISWAAELTDNDELSNPRILEIQYKGSEPVNQDDEEY